MERKQFLSIFPLAVLGSGLLKNDILNAEKKNETMFRKSDDKIEKAILAMLTMQRATWEQGVAMQALLEYGEEELVILMAKEAVLRQSPDGRLAMLGEEFALSDAASPGEAVLWAARKTGDENLFEGFSKLLNYILYNAPRNKDGIIYHFTNIPQVWSDINYMLPPFLVVADKYDEAIKQINGVWKVLWNEDKKLLSHMWDFEKNQFARKDCWGVGNGWTAAGFTRIIPRLPDSMKQERNLLIRRLIDLLDGCLKHMRSDGLYHNIVDDPNSFVETNLSQMLSYSIFRGVKGGWLDGKYLEKAELMRKAAHSKFDNYGLIQGVCGSPEFDHPGTATEGQAFFILMETAYKELNN
ncbi:MAG: glycoside hydrolase family 88 protein [Melioribacter sp.]|uniref:glycoside hydrolase family 88 protein n=1 Tax=Melioribacter sp. TaxID=2052167 RepID=UPI003BCCDDE2